VRRLLGSALIALAGSLSPLHAQAAEHERTLTDAIGVVKGATCLDEQRLEAEVRTWLGRDRVAPNVRVLVRGDAANPSSVEFWISHGRETRSRRFDRLPAGCDDAHAALGLAIALAIDANVLRRFVDLGPESRPIREVTFEIGGGHEVVPGYSLGGMVGVEHSIFDWLSARADVLASFSWNQSVAGTTGAFDALLVAATLRACVGGEPLGDVRVELCTGAGAGAIHSQGEHYTVSHGATGAWVGAASGLRLSFVLGIPWVVDLDMIVPIYAPAFRVDRGSNGSLYREPSPAGVLVDLGPALKF